MHSGLELSMVLFLGEVFQDSNEFNKLISVFLCVCPLIDDKFCLNIVKVL